jgi:hypothetical protein
MKEKGKSRKSMKEEQIKELDDKTVGMNIFQRIDFYFNLCHHTNYRHGIDW